MSPKLVLPIRIHRGCEHDGDLDYGMTAGLCVHYSPNTAATGERTAQQIQDDWGLADGDIHLGAGFLKVQGRKATFLSYN